MPSIHEQLSAQFYEWESRGRGWQVWPEPVSPEPPFRPLEYCLRQAVDDGRRPTLLSSLIRRLGNPKTRALAEPPIPEPKDKPAPEPLLREGLIELLTVLPAKLDLSDAGFEQFLFNLSLSREPIAFELLGMAGSVSVQFAAHPDDVSHVRRQLSAHFPEAVFRPQASRLAELWLEGRSGEALVVEFGLAREFVLPLALGKLDPFVGLVGTLAELERGELALYQVLFQPVQNPWAENMLQAVTLPDGAPLFVNAPELTREAEKKASRPMFAAVVRVGILAKQYERTVLIARDLAACLRGFAHPHPLGNELIPLANDAYPFDNHIVDLLRRQSRRSGMILNYDEILGFVHLPSAAVRSPAFVRQSRRSKPAPEIARHGSGTCLGDNVHLGRREPVYLTPEMRVRHLHVIGASGTGKTTLLFNLIRQDIENGEGVALLDPHGDLVDRILGIIPTERVKDVILLDPADEEYSIGFNILSAHSDLEKNLLASDLVSVFERLSTSWGDQMASVLNKAILAFLESTDGGTLADLRRFLLEPKFREQFLGTVRDPDVVYYWRHGFAQLAGNRSIGPVLTRLETFLSPKPIRYMVSQRENRLDFADILDTGKIFLGKLSQGAIGKENSFLLGSLLVAKFQETAMSRQRQAAEVRQDFWLYIDEFHNFITPSMAEILAGARKYRVGLILAHQELRQLQRDPEVASAVLSNPYTRVCFRVGDQDARTLASGFSSFEAKDLQNLGTGEAICRMERSDFDFNLRVPAPEEPDEAEATERPRAIIAASRGRYGRKRSDIETELYGAGRDELLQVPAGTARTDADQEKGKEAATEPVPSPVTTPGDGKPAAPKPPENKSSPAVSGPTPPAPTVPAAGSTVTGTPAAVPPKTAKSPPRPPPDLGRGGAQHRAIVERIKAAAEDLGYRAIIEKAILNNAGSVDLALEKPNRVFACEVTITTTTDHEVGNIAKCLKAGFGQAVMISPDEDRLRRIREAVRGALGATEAAKVAFFTPDDFLAHIEHLAVEDAKIAPEPERRRGYVIKRSVAQLTPEEKKAREQEALKVLAELMKRKPRRTKP
jgi:hypothetical protein